MQTTKQGEMQIAEEGFVKAGPNHIRINLKQNAYARKTCS